VRRWRQDEGFTLVEVVVAMVVFGLVSTGILTSANIVIRMTADNRSRVIATNLAEQQLDTDRGILDPFQIHNIPDVAGDPPLTQVVSGRTYTITQNTSLVSATGSDITCGSGQTIYYRRIGVQVDWSGRFASTAPVQSDTIISPNGRINDSSTGSIAVMITGSAGTGESGVSVGITPVSGGAMALQAQPAATDVDGCTYSLGVSPGTYSVGITRTNSVDPTQNPSPSTSTVTVVAGSTAAVNFTYDQSATYPLSYAAGASALLPSSMAVTFLSAGPPYITSSSAAAPSSVPLYPYPAGYSVIAGKEAAPNGNPTCAAEDPAAWTAVPGVKAGTRASAPGVQPGATSSTVAVPMGVFTVTAPPTSGLAIKAVGMSVTVNGEPGCTTGETFDFSQIVASGTTATFALPYGTYQLSSTTSPGGFTAAIGSPAVALPATALDGPLSSVTPLGVLTLDPRPAA
jgi:prepilin-type N-terminal cleavage/methylation domain-containing protein